MRITPKLFAGLTVAAGVSLVAAGIVYATSNQWSAGTVTGKALFPSLEQKVKNVATLELQQGAATLTIAREDKGWVAPDVGGYPVRPDRVRAVIVRLAQAELIEPKTRNPTRYALLDLDDPDTKGTQARRIRLLDKDGGVIAEAILGRKRWDAFGSGKAGTYVRLPDDPQTWLASLDIRAKPEIKGWVEAKIFGTETAKVSTVTLEHAGEAPLKIARAPGEKENFRVAELPAESKLKENGPSAKSVVKGFANIELEDLRKLAMTPAGKDISLARLETEDGLKVTFRLRKEKDANWLSLSAEGDGDAAKQAEKINARVRGWEYGIPAWKADTLFRHRSDFFETS